MKNKKTRLLLALFALLALAVLPLTRTQAAALTSISDTLSTLTQNTAANHTIQFVTPTGVDASTDTIIIDLTDFSNGGGVDYTDIDLAYDADGSCGTFSNTKTLASSAGAGVWGAAFSLLQLTLTAPTDAASGEIPAGRCVQVLIGTNASGGNAQLTNPNDTNTHTFDISGTFGDSGSFAIDFVSDDSVNVTATVDPSITFSISDTTVGFGTLTSSTGRWATGDTNGINASATTPTAAHTLSIGTNATGGWAITYNGATLTSGSDTICETPLTDCADVTNDSDGSPGTEQFGISASTDGDSTVTAGYERTATASFDFVPSTTTTLIGESSATATETISVSYLANIATNTEAGSYSTDITYIATATF